MATTRIISMHVSHGKTIADCLTDRIDYSKNPDKTQGGELISAYECDPKTADAEFLYSKRQYQTITGREQRHDVIAYQVRQSFKPGEITPEEANRVGYEFAERFLKGRHAFFVATHTDKKHIHNHIIWNSTTLDCKHKFRDFLGSGRAVARLSDAICTEHRLSVIADPKRGKNHYGKWLGDNAKPTHRELLCGLIDAALLQKPDSFDTLLKLLAGKEQPDAGQIEMPQGWHSALLSPDPYVITWTNVQRNVAMACGVGKTPEERYEKAADFVRLVGLQDFADLTPAELSTGMKQRLGLARAGQSGTAAADGRAVCLFGLSDAR